MNKVVALCVAVAMLAGCGFGRDTPAPSPRGSDPALEVIAAAASAQDSKPAQAATPEKSWVDSVDIDKIAENKWVWAAVFLLVQWAEIWYFNKTGRRSRTIDAAEAAMQPKLGIIQRMLYWIWRRVYFWKHRDQKDPDKEEEKKK